jgi:hypothetical protein
MLALDPFSRTVRRESPFPTHDHRMSGALGEDDMVTEPETGDTESSDRAPTDGFIEATGS